MQDSLEVISRRVALASWLTEVAFPIPLGPGGADLPAPGLWVSPAIRQAVGS